MDRNYDAANWHGAVEDEVKQASDSQEHLQDKGCRTLKKDLRVLFNLTIAIEKDLKALEGEPRVLRKLEGE